MENYALRRRRESKGWSQRLVAERVGTNRFTVTRWERGSAFPSPYFRQKLCELFETTAEELGLMRDQAMQKVEPSSPPYWNIPFRRNIFFTGREDMLARLTFEFSAEPVDAGPRICALSGLGGMGKTQVAVEYAYRHFDEYRALLWVQADTLPNLIAGFIDLASVLNLPQGNGQNTSTAIDAVKDWLKKQSHWLFILDNVENVASVLDFFPLLHAGHILITTRDQETGTNARRLQLEKMGVVDGSLLLCRRARLVEQESSFDAVKAMDYAASETLVHLLDGLPLALDQAAAYIEETDCGISGYLARYQQYAVPLLEKRGKTLLATDAVSTTWSLSFEKLRRTNMAAIELLFLCAFLSPEAIPEEIFLDGAPDLGPLLQEAIGDILGLDVLISELRTFSFIRRFAESNMLAIHRLVQTVIQESMDERTRQLWAERAVHAVYRAFHDASFANWQQCRRSLPHALRCAELIEQWSMSFPAAVKLLTQAGTYLRELAQYTQGIALYQQALAIQERTLDAHDLALATSLQQLALLYIEVDAYEQAETHLKRALDIRTFHYGEEHVQIASLYNDLALLYDQQSKFEQSEPLYHKALALYERFLEPNHLDIAMCLHNLGWSYMAKGSYAQAEPLYVRSLAIRRQQFPPDHPSLSNSLNLLGWLYCALGHYAQAELLYQEALAIRKHALGAEHPDIAGTLHQLADVYRLQQNYQQAELFYREALLIRTNALGAEHRDVAQSLHGLGKLFAAQGSFSQAEAFYQQALTIRERILGPKHASVAGSLNDLADVARRQGKYQDARHRYVRALDILEASVGRNHPAVATSLHGLAEISAFHGDERQAEQLYLQAIGIRQEVLGLEHPESKSLVESYHLFLLKSKQDKQNA